MGALLYLCVLSGKCVLKCVPTKIKSAATFVATLFILVKWVADVDNKYIPTICAVLGIALAIWMHWPAIDPSVILSGLFSGLAATGVDQLAKQVKK